MSKEKAESTKVDTKDVAAAIAPKEKGTPGRKVAFANGEVGVKYIADKVGCIPFNVREFLRANVRDMATSKGQGYKFTVAEADKIAADMLAKQSVPRVKKEKTEGEKKATKKATAAPSAADVVEDLEVIDAQLEELDDDLDI